MHEKSYHTAQDEVNPENSILVNPAQALAFIRQLYPDGGPDGAYLVLADMVSGGKPACTWLTLPEVPKRLGPWLQARSLGRNTYFGVALRTPRCEAHLRSPDDPVPLGGSMDVCAIPALVLDIDDLRGKHSETALPRHEDESLAFLGTLPWRPSFVVDTGGGLHVYYAFKEPYLIESDDERETIRDLSQRFRTYVIDAAKQRHSWELDMLPHLHIILRWPGTLNHKTEKPVPVRLIHEGAERYNPSDFETYLPPRQPRQQVTPGNSRTGDLNIMDVAEHYEVELREKNRQRDEWEGAHPVHGSTHDNNFNVNGGKGTWYCFRCSSGGGALNLIAVCEGLIECKESRPGVFKGKPELYRQAVDVANEKFGAGIDWQSWVEPEIPAAYEGPAYGDEDIPPGDSTGGNSANSAKDSLAEWESPLSLPALLPDVPKMTDDMLPHGLRPWLTDIAERVQCPLEYVAASAIVALASVIGRKVGIYPKQHDDWLVIPNLWGMLIGRPGVLKTPAMVEALRPLDRLVAQALGDYQRARKEYLLDSALHGAKLKGMTAEITKASKKGETPESLVMSLSELQGNAPEPPVEIRYKTNDTSVEKLQALLAENPNGLLLYRDELSGFLYALEKPGREGDREFYLECWNGSGSFTLDRIGRGTVHSKALCLSILGSIQPGKLMEYVGGAIGGGISDDGLLQRLQLAVWPDTSTEWVNIDRWPDTDAKNRAWQIFQRLASLQRELIPEPEHSRFDNDNPPALRFDAAAQSVFDDWRSKLENRLRSGALPPAMESHLAKYRSLMPSLSLIFHLTLLAHQVGEKDFTSGCITPVSEFAADMAIRWCQFLEKHAQRVYAADVDKNQHRAHALAKHILAGDVSDGDTVRSVYRHHWMMLKNPEDISAALSVLESLNWVRIETEPTGGRTRDIIRVNPAVTDENFFPFTQVTGAKSDKSPPEGQPADPFGTSGTCHLENGHKKITQTGAEEEEENSEKALLVTTDKSAKSLESNDTSEGTPTWWNTVDESF